MLIFLLLISFQILEGNCNKDALITLGKVEFSSKIRDFAWCGKFQEISNNNYQHIPVNNQNHNHKNVFMISENGVVYFSLDQGYNWVNLTK